MVSYGNKRGLRSAIAEGDKRKTRKYLQAMLFEGGIMKTERVVERLFLHHQMKPEAKSMVREVMDEQCNANRRKILRMHRN